ncbi:MAG: Uma2 family endonuclease [Chloroflexi bacterium]|nr:Uma2 family endonuclease [Chloroflexota bacterium]
MTQRPRIRYTYSDYLLLPEEKRYELIEGELCMVPSPTTQHQRLVLNLAMILQEFVRRRGLGEVFAAPLDVKLSEEDVVQPEVLFVRAARRRIVKEQYVDGPPDLVVEVLSPSTASRDRELKLKRYANFGVPEYWIVDPEAGSVEVLRLMADGYRQVGVFTQGTVETPLLPGLKLPVAEVMSSPDYTNG